MGLQGRTPPHGCTSTSRASGLGTHRSHSTRIFPQPARAAGGGVILLVIREAFLRGLSTRTVGRVVALLTEEPVSAQTVSRLAQPLDQAVTQFHRATLRDDWQYLFLDGVSLRVRRQSGRKRVQPLVVYRVRADGMRQLLAYTRSTGESQTA
ncbi:MAG: transposase [Nitrospira sp.]|nr:transposase [Nitrospira sp.]